MLQPGSPPADDAGAADIAERLQWLLRLRWLMVPVFVAVVLANDLLLGRRAPWTSLAVGGALLVLNGLYAWVLSRPHPPGRLLLWARFESALVTAVPLAVVLLEGDTVQPLRYGVLVGVVGAALVLPRTSAVAVVGMWAVAALIVTDALSLGFDPARIDPPMVARWAIEAGIILSVAAIASQLHSAREASARAAREATVGLERARLAWEASFEGLHEMIVVTDHEERVVRANGAFAKLLGARPHELAGRRLPDLLAGHPERWWSSPAEGILEVSDPVFDSLFSVTSTRAGDLLVRIVRDVGEHQRLYARLVQADKLAAIGVLASGAAHEINNPTAFVISNLSELKRYVAAYEGALVELSELSLEAGVAERVRGILQKGDLTFARREAANAITESVQGMDRIRQIVSNLRTLARREQAGEVAAPVDLADVVQAVVRTAASDLRAASARVDLAGPVWMMAHRGELVDVVLNLVVNAVQARDDHRPNRIAIDVLRDGGTAVLRVSDTGRGIAASQIKRLFEPSFTATGPSGDAALGLSLTRKIVAAHGGSIDVSSEVGAGSTFTLRFPALDPEQAEEVLRRREPGAA
jgi:PAS domain S-box-containing protein